MKKFTLICLLGLFLSITSHLHTKINASAWQVCTQNVIKKMFNEEPLYYIFYKNSNHLLPFYLTNPKIVFNMDRTRSGPERGFYSNFVIAVQDFHVFERRIFSTLRRITWIRFNYMNGRILVITQQVSLVKTIFRLFWQNDAIYVAVLTIDRNDPTRSRLFTANPHDAENNCGNFPQVVYVQSCDTSLTDIIPKAIRNYNGCAALFRINSVLKLEEFNPMTLTINAAVEILNISLETRHYMEARKNKSRGIEFEEAFLASPVYQENHVSYVYSRDVLAWVVPPTDRVSNLEILLLPFERDVWLLAIATFILLNFAWYVVDKFKTGLNTIVLNTASMTLCGNVIHVPKASTLRFLIMCYIIYSIHIQTAYIGNLMRLITSPPIRKPIQSVQELLETDLTVCLAEPAQEVINCYCYPEAAEVFNKLKGRLDCLSEYDSLKLMARWSAQPNFCIPILLQTLHAVELSLQIRTPHYFVDNRVTGSVSHIMASPRTTYIVDSVSEIIIWLTESGLYDRLEKAREFHSNAKKREFISEDGVVALSFDHLSGVLLIYSFGVIISMIAFACELIVFHCKK